MYENNRNQERVSRELLKSKEYHGFGPKRKYSNDFRKVRRKNRLSIYFLYEDSRNLGRTQLCNEGRSI